MLAIRKPAVAGLDAPERSPGNAPRLPGLALLFIPRIVPRIIPRMPVKFGACLLAALLLRLVFAGPAMGQEVLCWTPYVTALSTTSATVNWLGSDNDTGLVEYATESYFNEHAGFQSTVTSLTVGAYQHVPLTNLEPNTAYVYRVRMQSSSTQFGIRRFKTMPVSGPFTFLVISDSHAQENRFEYVTEAIANYETDALFILDGGDYASYDYKDYWDFYFEYGDGMFAKFPVVHAIGNHEYHNYGHSSGPPTSADEYHWAFDVPEGAALNYSFDCAGVRFFMLNSPDPSNAKGDDPQTSLALAQSQAAWLEEQLDHDMAGTFTIHHHPIWDYGSTGINPDLQPWETLYHQFNISANFAGHTHNYQRYSVQNIPYFVVGNAGGIFKDMDDNAPRAKWYQYGETRQLGYLRVTVNPEENSATAQEIFVAYVDQDDSETATVYDPPIIGDTVTFPLALGLSTITVTRHGLGSGVVSSSDARIGCGPVCTAKYKKKRKITLTPIPDKGSVFSGWTGACSGRAKCSATTRPGKDIIIGTVFDKGCCRYSLSQSKKTVGYKGGKAVIRVTGKDYNYCRTPEIVNNTDWLTWSASDFHDNKGSVTINIRENDNAGERTGTMTVGGKTFTATQKGKP